VDHLIVAAIIASTIQHWLTGSLLNNELEGSTHGLIEVLTHYLS